MYDILKSTNSENTNQYKLIPLTVADAAKCRLLEHAEGGELLELRRSEPDILPDDDGMAALALCLWALLILIPFVMLAGLSFIARGF